MSRQPLRRTPVRGPHALVPAAEPRRFALRTLIGFALALSAGVVIALGWLARHERGSLETLPAPAAQATPRATQPAPSEPPLPAAADAPLASPSEAVAVAPAGNRIGQTQTLQSAGSVPSQPLTLALPTPTATSTPPPPLAQVEGVVGLGGADLLDERGVRLARVPQGALLAVTSRTTDGAWLAVRTEDGTRGWMATDAVIVFDAGRLAATAVTIVPRTATTTTGVLDLLPTPTPGTAAGQADAGVTAQVTLRDARLNLRAGPGAGYAIIAKAQPGERLVVLARNAAGDWLQVAQPELPGGFAWAAAAYLAVEGPLTALPVRATVSAAPSFGEPVAPPRPDAQGQYATPAPAPTGLTGTLAIQTEWGGDIYLYDLTSGALRHLTGGFDPAISPDGTQVAFTRSGGEHGLYLIGVDGSNERRIFSGRELLFSPKWSPDGRYLVFERGDEVIECLQFGPRCLPSSNPPIGARLTTERQQQLARVDVNGNNYRDVPSLPRAHAPDWQAGGIVYHSPAGIQKTQDHPDARSELVFFNIRKQYELDPDWQPNGNRIVFQRREASHWQIFAVNADGSDLRGLTRPEFTLVDELPSSVAPAWSPDGRHIVFLSNRTAAHSTGPWRVWVMDADGSNQRPLPIDLPITYTFVGEQMVDWGP